MSHAELSSALEQFASRWSIAAAELVEDMDGRARRLTESAQEYSRLESLLVPRALR